MPDLKQTRPRPKAKPVEYAETRKEAKRLLEAAWEIRVAAIDSEFNPQDPEGAIACWSFSSGDGDRYVVHGEQTSVFADWLNSTKVRKVYSDFKADVKRFLRYGVDLEPSFHADIVSLSWFRDEHLFQHGLKPQMRHWRHKKRPEFTEIFSYVRHGYVKPTLLMPDEILSGRIPAEALLIHSAEEWKRILIEYSGDDAFDTGDLYWLHREALERVGYWPTYLRVDRPYTLVLMRNHERGVLIDQKRMREIQLLAQVDGMRQEHKFRSETGAPDGLNFNAPKQMTEFLNGELGWPVYEDLRNEPPVDDPDAEGSASVGKDTLARWIGEGITAAAHLRDTKRSYKLVRDVDSLIAGLSADGRLRSNFKQHGADTGRISSAQFKIKRRHGVISMKGLIKVVERQEKIGANLQNIVGKGDKDKYGLRACFIAARVGDVRADGSIAVEGCVLIVLDFSGFELCMMLHWVSKIHPQSKMLAVMNQYGSPSAVHAFTAINFFKLPIQMDDWKTVKKSNPDEYKTSKNMDFNLLYKGSPRMLASLREQDPNDDDVMAENTALFEGFYELYPEVTEYQEWSIDHGYKHGWVPTVGGRRCHVEEGLASLDDYERSHWERKCTNGPCQGSAANIVKLAMVLIEQDEELKELGCLQLLQVHDEIVAEVPQRNAERAMARMLELMKSPYKKELGVKLEVEGKFAENWLLAK